MTAKLIVLAAVPALLLAGCNRGTEANNQAAAPPAANAALPGNAAGPAPAGPLGGPVDQAFIVGHWGASGDCSRTLTFNADGTAASSGSDDPVRWTLTGDRLTTVENDNPPENVTASRAGEMLLIATARGERIELTRCPAAAPDQPTPPAAAPGNAN